MAVINHAWSDLTPDARLSSLLANIYRTLKHWKHRLSNIFYNVQRLYDRIYNLQLQEAIMVGVPLDLHQTLLSFLAAYRRTLHR